MADTKISALPAASLPLSGSEELPLNDSGVSSKITVANLHTGDVHATYSEYASQAAVPAVPTGAIRIFSQQAARHLPRFIGPSGLDSSVQPALFGNNVVMWLPGTSSTAAINFGVSWTVNTTQATPAIANSNFMTQMKRATFTTTTTAANTTGVRGAAAVCWIGSAAGQGGFYFVARFGILTYTSTMRVFVGLSALTTALAADPSATANSCGMSKDTGETTWQCLTVNGGPSATKISTGRTTAAAGAAEVFDMRMFCAPNGTSIIFNVQDITSGTVLVNNTSQTLTLPVNTVMLTPHAECMNVAGGAGSAVAIFLNKIYIETDN